ncbi:hypothetical protein B0H14DRAFT_956269 [Mycena olivaceomarginata]|nr:hypothetical protein B0H14DRAFT_956269 [Mycena olivaceomarginata]
MLHGRLPRMSLQLRDAANIYAPLCFDQSRLSFGGPCGNCLPGPLPDPQPINLSESAFAALVFDGGNCDSCGTMTLNMYSSWSLRVRFCSRRECRESWARKHTRKITNFDILPREARKALAWIPLAESPACFSLSEAHTNPSNIWPQAPKIYRISAMDAALAEYATESSSVVDKRHAAEITASPLKCRSLLPYTPGDINDSCWSDK